MTELRRVLGLGDLVLLNIVAIVGLRWWLTTASGYGYGALPLWVLACLAFFIPSALAVIDLTTRHPEEGGIYAWAKRAFGDAHGFISGWCLWTNNLFYFPTLLIFVAGNLVFVLGPERRILEEDRLFMAAVSLVLFWICLAINIRGLGYGRWINNAGALGTWIPAALLILLGGYALLRFGAETPFEARHLVPRLSLGTLAFFSTMCFGLSGIELGSMMSEEIVEPRRNVPRAIYIGGAVVTAVYVLGCAALLIALPREEIGLLSGVAYAIAAVQRKAGLGFLAGASALLIGLGGLGALSAWLAGASRLPFVAGIDRYLPRSFGHLHPRYGSPHVALLATGGVSTLVILMSFSGAAVRDAYTTLYQFTIIVYFIPYLYLFASLIRLTAAGDAPTGAIPVPGGRAGAIRVGSIGVLTTSAAVVFALAPPEGTARPAWFVAKILAGCALVLLCGWALYRRGRRASRSGG
ncbi:MAG: APC family permease [Acidobacteriota bacterium]